MAVKCGAAPLGLLLALPVGAALPGRLASLVLVSAPVAAFLAPDLWLRRRARRRGGRMADELADVADLLRIAVEGGSALVAGHGRGRASAPRGPRRRAARGRGAPGRWASPTRTCSTSSSAAAPPTGSARWPPPCAAPTATAPRSARRSHRWRPDARAQSARRIATRAARAAPKIQLVVALLLVPAVLLLVAAALLAGLS
jgi:tight adherence protein C